MRILGRRFVLLTRLSPLPGFALNYLLSLTKVRFADYAVGTAVGIIPSVLNLCLIGAAARDVGSIAANSGVSHLVTVVRFTTLAIMLIVSVLITRNAEKDVQFEQTKALFTIRRGGRSHHQNTQFR